MGRRYVHLSCPLGVNGWWIARSLMLGQEEKTVVRDSLAKSPSIIRCCTRGPRDWRLANLASCGSHSWLMTRNIRGLVLELVDCHRGISNVARLTIRARVSRRVKAVLKRFCHFLIPRARRSSSPTRGEDMAQENLILTSM